MRVLFRAEADPETGGGHVMRCLALAGELSRRGHRVTFLAGATTSETVPALAREGIEVVSALDRPPACDLLVVDHYGLGADAQRALAGATGAGRVLVVDDLANRRYDCDLLLDATLGREAPAYDGLLPGRAGVLAGSTFALLRPEFARLRSKALARRGSGAIRRILVSIGLTDLGGVTLPAVEALRAVSSHLPKLEGVDVVVGAGAPSLHRLRRLARGDSRIAVHVDSGAIAELATEADVAIGAGGTSAWERCCLGLPTILLVLADNQVGNARALAAAGAGIALERRQLDERLPAAVRILSEDPGRVRAMSVAASRICDGLGTARVADAATGQGGSAEPVLALRRVRADDADILLRWRNDPATRMNSRNSDRVRPEDHRNWLAARLGDPGLWHLLGQLGGEAIGTVRFDPPAPDGRREVSIIVAPSRRGRGLGARLLAAGCRRLRAEGMSDPVVGWIREGNAPSLACFVRSGFVEMERRGGWVAMSLAAGAWPSAGPFSTGPMERAAS